MSGVFKPTKRWAPGPHRASLWRATGRPVDLALGRNPRIWSPGRCGSTTLAISISLIANPHRRLLRSCSPVREAGQRGSRPRRVTHALLIGSVLGMVLLAEAQNLVTFFRRDRDPLDPRSTSSAPPTCVARASLESGAQVPHRRLARIGDAASTGMAFLYGGQPARPTSAGIGPRHPGQRPGRRPR